MSHNPPRSVVFGRWNRVQIMKHFKCHCTLEVQLYLLVSRHYFPLPRCHWLHSHSLHKFHFSTPEKVRIWPKLKKGTQKSRNDRLGIKNNLSRGGDAWAFFCNTSNLNITKYHQIRCAWCWNRKGNENITIVSKLSTVYLVRKQIIFYFQIICKPNGQLLPRYSWNTQKKIY